MVLLDININQFSFVENGQHLYYKMNITFQLKLFSLYYSSKDRAYNYSHMQSFQVDYQTKAKNRSPAGESFFMPSTMSNNSTTTVINGVTSHHRTDFNGAINHIAVVPPMKSYHNETTSPSQQQKKPFSQQPHNMSLPLRSTSSSSPCQYSLDSSKYLLCIFLELETS